MDNRMREIIEELNKKGITTAEIIKESGVGRTQFYSTLNGTSIPKLTTAIGICKALRADIKYVFPEIKEAEKNEQIINKERSCKEMASIRTDN